MKFAKFMQIIGIYDLIDLLVVSVGIHIQSNSYQSYYSKFQWNNIEFAVVMHNRFKITIFCLFEWDHEK